MTSHLVALFFNKLGTTDVTIVGPACWAAGRSYLPEFKMGQVFMPDFKRGQGYLPEFKAGQEGCN